MLWIDLIPLLKNWKSIELYLYNLPFVQNADRHNHLTRAQGNLYMMRPKHEYVRYSIRYCISLIVNESPPQIWIKLILITFKGFPNIIRLISSNPTEKTVLIKTAIFDIEICKLDMWF